VNRGDLRRLNRFGLGSTPDPTRRAHDALSDPRVEWGGDTCSPFSSSLASGPKGASFSCWIGTPTFYTKVTPLEVHHKMTTEQSQHNVHSLKEFMCKTESFRAGKEHCIIQTALHAVMLSSKTAVLVCAFRFSCPPCPPHLSKVGGTCPLSPWCMPPVINTLSQLCQWTLKRQRTLNCHVTDVIRGRVSRPV